MISSGCATTFLSWWKVMQHCLLLTAVQFHTPRVSFHETQFQYNHIVVHFHLRLFALKIQPMLFLRQMPCCCL